MTYYNRRQFLTRSSAVGFAAGLGAVGAMSNMRSWAANTSGYKALVFVFLKGGMDHADTIIPYDQASYNQITSVRAGLFGSHNFNSSSSSRNRSNLLALSPQNASDLGGRQFSLPRELSSLKDMFDREELAVVGNVGPLLNPVTRTQIENGTATLPARLFSHNDQQSTWMSFGVEGTRFGWGGRFVDQVLNSAPDMNASFAAISTGSNDVFLSGNAARPIRISAGGALAPSLLTSPSLMGRTAGDDAARSRIEAYLSRSDLGSRNIFARDLTKAQAKSLENAEALTAARESSTPISTVFPGSRLGAQLQSVAETINVQQRLNVSRQIFYVTMPGFDTHSNQAEDIVELHQDMADGFAAFRSAMQEIGRWNDVTLSTMSDFGRTMVDNGDGTDHGWAGHHLIMGGSVRGARLYGDYPDADVDGPNFTPFGSRQIPTVSVEQYAATLGRWFGLSSGELAQALPRLSEFNTSDLGFMS